MLFSLPTVMFAQQSITTDALNKIKQGYNQSDISTKATANALSANDVKRLTLNRNNVGKTDSYFKYKVKVKGITDQKSSGRCWMYTSLNIFRPVVIDKLKVSNFEFSQTSLACVICVISCKCLLGINAFIIYHLPIQMLYF